MADAAVSFAVETLGKLLIDKAVFLKGVKGEVEWMRDELKRMQCFLRDASKKQSDDDRVRNWISDVRRVAHDAEDVIEMFVLNVESKGLKERCACFPNHMYHLNKVGEEIESIRKRLKEIDESRVRYDIQRAEASTMTRSKLEVEMRRRLADWQNDKHLVGMDEDVENLLRKAIFEKSEALSVSAILGMGGIGKSTLAKKIYNHPKVVSWFEFRAWVVVSSEFTPEDVMKQILLKLGISLDELRRLESMDDRLRCQEELKKEVHKRLTGKRYFIVLDDVWEAAHWESLSTAFPDGDKANRLLLTSRNQAISTQTGYVHNMKLLDANQSSQMFWRKVADNSNRIFPEDLRNIGEEILKKCSGLPLAISVVGGLLARKTRSKSEWQRVLREMKYSDVDRSRGDISTISAILELSYQNLPPELKACFLCLGFFKEDKKIGAKDLVYLWIALGLVVQEVVGEEERKEDVARHYLNELISRNMLQVKKMGYDTVRYCQIHDLLRDLSIRKAKEEIDFEVLREEWGSNQFSLSKPRHRAIYCRREPSFSFLTNRNQYIRSLFIHGHEWTHYHETGPSSYWKSFELLRVLNLGNASLRVFPKAIGELTGLRCLVVHCVWNDAPFGSSKLKLPRSWAKLKNLEVLDLLAFGEIIILDKVILEMHNLQHLHLSEFRSKVDLRRMRKLESLRLLQVEDSDLWQLHGMTHIYELWLDVSYVLDGSSLFEYLVRLENLVTLGLVHSATYFS